MLAKIRQVQDLALLGTVHSTSPDCTRKTQPFVWSPLALTENCEHKKMPRLTSRHSNLDSAEPDPTSDSRQHNLAQSPDGKLLRSYRTRLLESNAIAAGRSYDGFLRRPDPSLARHGNPDQRPTRNS